jgi:hypothetical protein
MQFILSEVLLDQHIHNNINIQSTAHIARTSLEERERRRKKERKIERKEERKKKTHNQNQRG